MPIVNYKAIAKAQVDIVKNDTTLSKENKAQLNDFLEAYNVTPARLTLFLRHIVFLLREIKDVKAELNNRRLVNKVFQNFKEKLSDSYYSTIVNVSLRYVKWLNDGDRPIGYKDIKNISKKKQMRDLSPEDMITWQDGLKIAQQTNSVQLKAVIMAQLDGGFRPSEFIDLDYGDISVKKNFIVARVKAGKTGSRDVVLFKAVPYLQRWLSMHPTKKKDDPLWIIESPNKSHRKIKTTSRRYPYVALKKRIRELAEKVGINKPMDFYNLRHSACSISKLDNVNPGLAAEKFGHTVEYYERTYGRIDTKGKIERFKKAYNLEAEKEKKETTRYCEICGTVNEPNAEFCEKCSRPLTLDKAMESYNELKDLKNKMDDMIKRMQLIEKYKESSKS